MTTRRPPHIHGLVDDGNWCETGSLDDISLASSDSEQENAVKSPIKSKYNSHSGNLYTQYVTLPITSDFGPRSLKAFLKEEIEKNQYSCNTFENSKGKGRDNNEDDQTAALNSGFLGSGVAFPGHAIGQSLETQRLSASISNFDESTSGPPLRLRSGRTYVSQPHRVRNNIPSTNTITTVTTTGPGRRRRIGWIAPTAGTGGHSAEESDLNPLAAPFIPSVPPASSTPRSARETSSQVVRERYKSDVGVLSANTLGRANAFQQHADQKRRNTRSDHVRGDMQHPSAGSPDSRGAMQYSTPIRKAITRTSGTYLSEESNLESSPQTEHHQTHSASRSSSEPRLRSSRLYPADGLATVSDSRDEGQMETTALEFNTFHSQHIRPRRRSSSMSGLSDNIPDDSEAPPKDETVLSSEPHISSLLDGAPEAEKQHENSTYLIKACSERHFQYQDVLPEVQGQQPKKRTRAWHQLLPPVSPLAPPFCEASENGTTLLEELSADVWCLVATYLSSEDVRHLRLVSRDLAATLAPVMFRSCVTKFGKTFFHPQNQNGTSASASMFDLYGSEINKFGISFDYDFWGLASAKAKELQKEESAWFGSFKWPVDRYPRHGALQELEELSDDNGRLLGDAMAKLDKVSELGLSMDSGHGWMNGPDSSDLAIFEEHLKGGSPIFGINFTADDAWYTFSRNEYFRWAQQNSINETIKAIGNSSLGNHTNDLAYMRRVQVKDYDMFKDVATQLDRNRDAHTGDDPELRQSFHNPAAHNAGFVAPAAPNGGFFGVAPGLGGMPGPQAQALMAMAAAAQQQGPNAFALMAAAHQHMLAAQNAPPAPHGRYRSGRNSRAGNARRRRRSPRPAPIIPQWPLIFSAHNVAAEVGGHLRHLRHKVEPAWNFPLNPAALTEAQVQWLLETAWAQCAFISAYTTSIIKNKHNFGHVHTLHIVKFSSGLLASLEQRKFWTSLPSLRSLRILVKPDWRKEHVPHDTMYQSNMPLSPTQASIRLAEFLRDHIARLENLSSLTVGFSGGGEHATGIFARNQHVLPAPITTDPQGWLSNHTATPNRNTMIKFDHIRKLTFENCWFSPCMLEAFMTQSRDTSLRELTLDSVSLTGKHKPSTANQPVEQPLTTISGNLKCVHDPSSWLHEIVPFRIACWVETLDRITPGPTLLDCKYAANMIDEEIHPRPSREFRGNIETIRLKSCGYVTVTCASDLLGQSNVVVHYKPAMDEGLVRRRTMLSGRCLRPADNSSHANPTPIVNQHNQVLQAWSLNLGSPRTKNASCVSDHQNIMMSTVDPVTKEAWFGLGKLTQCVHPIEKRVLEGMWRMKFGWGNSMERWGAVEDGCFEGGTGRFSGVVRKDDSVNAG